MFITYVVPWLDASEFINNCTISELWWLDDIQGDWILQTCENDNVSVWTVD